MATLEPHRRREDMTALNDEPINWAAQLDASMNFEPQVDETINMPPPADEPMDTAPPAEHDTSFVLPELSEEEMRAAAEEAGILEEEADADAPRQPRPRAQNANGPLRDEQIELTDVRRRIKP